jgi:pyrimidine-specific ribonucleoside hydrolase
MNWRKTAALGALTLIVTACAAGGSADPPDPVTSVAPTTMETTTTLASAGTPVIMDTDVAAEGIMSIIYLVGQDEIDIQAVTVSGTGLVHCEEGVQQVLGVLEMMGADDIPVACGPESPLEGHNAFPTSWRVVADHGYGLDLSHGRSAADEHATDLIARVIRSSPVPVIVYADGPQTNLAQALRDHPDIADNIEMAYVMGGAIDVPGNAIRNPDAEWNIWVDPVAASEVLGSGIPITLVPLDATNQVPLHIFHREALRRHQENPGAEAVLTMLDNSDQLETGGLFFWDQLTAAILVDDSYATIEDRSINVILDEDRSVAGVTEESPNGSSMQVTVGIDRERFESDFLSAIAGVDVGPIVAEPDWSVTFDGESWTTDLSDSLLPDQYVVNLVNTSNQEALIAVGWLTGEATVADMDAWESISQPPWYELESAIYMAANTDVFGVLSLESLQQYVLVGLDPADDIPTRFAVIDVGSSDPTEDG